MPTGQFSSLEQLFLKGIRVLWNHPQATVNDSFLPVNNLAALYGASGNYPARDQANSRILALAEQLAVPITSQVAQVFIHLGSLYERAGRPKAAAILYRPLHPFMMAQDEIALETRVEWIGMYAKVLMADSQFEQALQMGEQALSALQASPGFDDGHRIGILNLMGSAARQKARTRTLRPCSSVPRISPGCPRRTRTAKRPAPCTTTSPRCTCSADGGIATTRPRDCWSTLLPSLPRRAGATPLSTPGSWTARHRGRGQGGGGTSGGALPRVVPRVRVGIGHPACRVRGFPHRWWVPVPATATAGGRGCLLPPGPCAAGIPGGLEPPGARQHGIEPGHCALRSRELRGGDPVLSRGDRPPAWEPRVRRGRIRPAACGTRSIAPGRRACRPKKHRSWCQDGELSGNAGGRVAGRVAVLPSLTYQQPAPAPGGTVRRSRRAQ